MRIQPAILLLTASCIGVSLPRVAAAAVWHVRPGGSGAQTGVSWDEAFASPRDALAVASSSDEVWVAAGTYAPTAGADRTISFALVDGVAVYGGFAGTETLRGERDWATNVTVLSGDLAGDDDPTKAIDDSARNNAENSYHVVVGAADARLDGFTITAGNADGVLSDSSAHGGGMIVDSITNLTVVNCVFAANRADTYGGGMHNTSSSLTVTACTFADNRANMGGGMCNWSSLSRVAACTFTRNSAGSSNSGVGLGGGLVCGGGKTTVTGCTFSGNSASSRGGAICNWASNNDFTDCVFTANSAFKGGALWVHGGPNVVRCRFVDNSASFYGGALYANYNSDPQLGSCAFVGNSARDGGGIFLRWNSKSMSATNCTFAGNSATAGGGGIDAGPGPSVAVTNCILWGNTASGGADLSADFPGTVSYSCVQAGWPGEGNTAYDPLLVDLSSGDVNLMPGSPCIDAADGAAAPATDIEGNARWDDPGSDDVGAGTPTFADMGAHESQSTSTPVITVTLPDDGEEFVVYTVETIGWTTTGGRVSCVRVEFSRDGGATWEYLDGGTAIPNTGRLHWVLPGRVAGDCRLRVSDAADADPSDTAAFAIIAAPFGGGCGGWVEGGARRPGGAAWLVPLGLALLLLARARGRAPRSWPAEPCRSSPGAASASR